MNNKLFVSFFIIIFISPEEEKKKEMTTTSIEELEAKLKSYEDRLKELEAKQVKETLTKCEDIQKNTVLITELWRVIDILNKSIKTKDELIQYLFNLISSVKK